MITPLALGFVRNRWTNLFKYLKNGDEQPVSNYKLVTTLTFRSIDNWPHHYLWLISLSPQYKYDSLRIQFQVLRMLYRHSLTLHR